MLTFFWRTSISSVAQCTLWSCRCLWYPAGWCRANLHVSKRGYCQVRFIGVSVSPKCYVLCNAMENLGSHSQREACGREMWGPPAEPKARERNSELKTPTCLALDSQRGPNLQASSLPAPWPFAPISTIAPMTWYGGYLLHKL